MTDDEALDLAARDTADDFLDRGACVTAGVDMFPPSDEDAAAKSVCARCHVTDQCLDYALARHIEHGIWGGTNEADRRKIRRNRRKAAAAQVAA